MLDPPPPYRPGRLARLAGRLSPGIDHVLATVPDRAEAWYRASLEALDGDQPLWLVLGDSTAQGIGSSSLGSGYVGQLRRRLHEAGRRLEVVNVARTGARIDDVRGRQLATLGGLTERPALITCSVGSNDVMQPGSAALAARRMRDLLGRLAHAAAGGTEVIVATVPQGTSSLFARRLNATIRREAPRHDIAVADVARTLTGPFAEKVARDRFHPNDRGYADWARAFLAPLGLEPVGAPD